MSDYYPTKHPTERCFQNSESVQGSLTRGWRRSDEFMDVWGRTLDRSSSFLNSSRKGMAQRAYEDGLRLEFDNSRSQLNRAADCYRKASDNDHPLAKFRLGWLLFVGFPEEQRNSEKAAKLMEEAAYSGVVPAQMILGIMYFQGTGVKKDLVKSYVWQTIAVAGGFSEGAEACEVLGKALTPFQLAKARGIQNRVFNAISNTKSL